MNYNIMSPLELVQTLNQITMSGSGDGLREIVTDDIVFDGPLFKASGAAEFIPGFQRWIDTKKVCRILSQTTVGNDVYTTCEMDVYTEQSVVTLREADWIETVDGKISKIHIYFDPRELLKATGR